MIVETVKSETYRADQQPGNSDKNGCHSIEGEVLQETPVLSFKDFNWLDEAYPHYGGESASLKV